MSHISTLGQNEFYIMIAKKIQWNFQKLKSPYQCNFLLQSYIKLFTQQNNKQNNEIQKELHTMIGSI